MRVAIYARYSTENQRDASIEDQIRECERFVAARGWQVVQRYADHAISGKVKARPQFQQLLRAAMDLRFDVVVSEALDRLSRDLQDTAGFFKLLEFHGVRIVTLAEGEINMMAVGFKGTMNAMYAADSADKTRRGMRGNVEKGKSGGGLCYGYLVAAGGDRIIHEDEAAIVRRIFTEFTEKALSPKGIAKRLNVEGIPGPRGFWAPSTIHGHISRGTGILNNELYIGKLVWNRRRYVLHPLTRKRIPRVNGSDDLVRVDVPHLRIISDDVWSATKQRQIETQKRVQAAPSVHVARRPRYLFSGLTRCGVCGHGYTVYSAHHLTCAGARDRGVCGNLLTIRREEVERRVLRAMALRFSEGVREFCEQFEASVLEMRSGASEWNGDIKRKLADVNRELGNYYDAIGKGVAVEALTARIAAKEAEKAQLEASLRPTLLVKVPARDEMLSRFRGHLGSVLHAFESEEGRDAAADRIRSMVTEVRLQPDNGVLGILVKPNSGVILSAAGYSLSSNDGCGGPQPLLLDARWVAA